MVRRRSITAGAAVALVAGLAGPLAARMQPAETPAAPTPPAAADPLNLDSWGLGGSAGVEAGRPDPAAGSVEMVVALVAGDSIADILDRAGVVPTESRAAAAALTAHIPSAAGRNGELSVLLGEPAVGNRWALERVVLTDDWGTAVEVARSGSRFVARATTAGRDLRRIRGSAGNGLYWSVRAAGVPTAAAAEYVAAVGDRLAGAANPADQFDVVMAGDRLVYAGLERSSGTGVQLVKWPTGDGAAWLDPAAPKLRSSTLVRPVAGPVSSSFGHRIHPILRFARFHRGVDFRAAWGTPVRAAADGIVLAASWNGGYGRQVRIAHPGGIQTSYAHMSRITARPGSTIRQGEVIGLVGSSGFSTGPHLHYEMTAHGRSVDPLAEPHASSSFLLESDEPRLRLRHRQLLSLPAQAPRRA